MLTAIILFVTGHSWRNQVFTCLNGQLVVFEILCGVKKPHSSAKNLVSEPRCKKCPVVNYTTQLVQLSISTAIFTIITHRPQVFNAFRILPIVLNSVDHDLRLKADHSPRLGRWTVVQREQFVIY